MGLAARENLGIQDTQVAVTRDHQIRVVEIIRRLRPRTVILAPNDMRHPDHTAAERLCFEGCYFAGLRNFDERVAHLEPHRPFKVLRVHAWRQDSRPSLVVDVTENMDAKIAAVKAFKTQFPDDEKKPAGVSWLRTGTMEEWLRSRARYYGMLIGKQYGEGLVQTEVFEIDDLVTLPVQSM